MPDIFISTAPFGEADYKPIELLKATGWNFKLNPYERKLTPEEVSEMAQHCDGLIAGTENIEIVLRKAKKLKIISRVGIGLDSVPLQMCRDKGIVVTYTPDAVTMAVAELAMGIMITLTRHVGYADRQIRKGNWKRIQGKRIGKSVVGIIGFGRIGFNLAKLLVPFHPEEVLVNDILDKSEDIELLKKQGLNIRTSEKDEIYKKADIVSLHVPLTPITKGMINEETFNQFKKEAFILNLARGGIICEDDLISALKRNTIAGAAIDCFEEEPYQGPLSEFDNVLLTQHMGSCSFDCRAAMEIEATKDLIRFFKNEPLENIVPYDEYIFPPTEK